MDNYEVTENLKGLPFLHERYFSSSNANSEKIRPRSSTDALTTELLKTLVARKGEMWGLSFQRHSSFCFKIDDVTNGLSKNVNHKIKNISGNI